MILTNFFFQPVPERLIRLLSNFNYIFRRRFEVIFLNRFSKSSLKNEQSMMRILKIEFAILLNKYAL